MINNGTTTTSTTSTTTTTSTTSTTTTTRNDTTTTTNNNDTNNKKGRPGAARGEPMAADVARFEEAIDKVRYLHDTYIYSNNTGMKPRDDT